MEYSPQTKKLILLYIPQVYETNHYISIYSSESFYHQQT